MPARGGGGHAPLLRLPLPPLLLLPLAAGSAGRLEWCTSGCGAASPAAACGAAAAAQGARVAPAGGTCGVRTVAAPPPLPAAIRLRGACCWRRLPASLALRARGGQALASWLGGIPALKAKAYSLQPFTAAPWVGACPRLACEVLQGCGQKPRVREGDAQRVSINRALASSKKTCNVVSKGPDAYLAARWPE